MKIKIVVNGMEGIPGQPGCIRHSAEVWSGEMNIAEGIYVTKISVIAEGEPHPICDVPFSLTEGHWMWIPASFQEEMEPEKIGGTAYNEEGRPIRT